MNARKLAATGLVIASALVLAQGWKTAYQNALGFAKNDQWPLARDAFKDATAERPEDEASGGISGPFSPNFGAAYAAYRMALSANGESAQALYLLASQELEVLAGKGRASREAYGVLSACYLKLGKAEEARVASTKAASDSTVWKSDVTFLTKDDLAAFGPRPSVAAPEVKGPPAIRPGQVEKMPGDNPRPKPLDAPVRTNQPAAKKQEPAKASPVDPKKPQVAPEEKKQADTPTPAIPKPVGDAKTERPKKLDDPGSKANRPNQAAPTTNTGPVSVVQNKYALIIGNSQSAITDLSPAFGVQSGETVRDALINDAGYDPANVVTLTDAKIAQIRQAATDLAARVPEQGVVFIYFAGVAVNVDGKDYLAGTDTASASDVSTLVRKAELLQLFVVKGARIFAFYECSRPPVNRTIFGQEQTVLGSIAETYATISGQQALPVVSGGKQVGMFAKSVASVLHEFRSNAVPVSDFVWEVFYNMKRGGQTGDGGGSLQTPTLPIVRNMPSEARF